MISYDIDWTDPTKDEIDWLGRMLLVQDIDWTGATDETNWLG